MCCFACKSDNLTTSSTTDDFRFGDTVFSVVVPCVRCEACGVVTIAPADSERAELAVAYALAAHGPVTGPAFRHMRNALGIARGDMARLLGVAPETVSRWEHGDRAVDRAAWLLVSTLVDERRAGRQDTLARLRSLPDHPTSGIVSLAMAPTAA